MDNKTPDIGWMLLSVVLKHIDPEGKDGFLYNMANKLHELGLDGEAILDFQKWLYVFLKNKEEKGMFDAFKFPKMDDDEFKRLINSETKEDE